MIPKRARLYSWDGPLPEIGTYLKTHAGSVYLVIQVTPNTRPDAKTIARLDMLKLMTEDIQALDQNTQFGYIRWGNNKYII